MLFQVEMTVNIPLEAALDQGWRILADCFEPVETGVPAKIIDQFWPKKP